MRKILWIAALAVLGLTAVTQAQTVVYQSNFDTATNMVSAGLDQAQFDESSTWIFNDTDNRVESDLANSNDRTTLYTTNSWQNAGGFTLETTFMWAADGTRFSFGLYDAAATVNGSTDWVDGNLGYGIGLTLDGVVAGDGDALVLVDQSSGAVSVLSTNQGNMVVGTEYDLSMTVTSAGWSYSIDGATASTGTFATAFDTTKDFRFISHAQSPVMDGTYFSNITVTALPLEEAVLFASGPIAMDLVSPDTTATGSVELAYGTVSDDMEITSIAVSDESHGVGSFNVLSTSPDTLGSTNAGTSTLEVEFNNSVAGLVANGSSATGLVTVTWTETGSGVTNDTVVAVSTTYTAAYLEASGPIAMELIDPATTATGSVELAYGTVSDDMEITSIAVSDESHGVGSFNVLSTSPDTLASTNAGTATLEVEFDNSVAGLLSGSATGLVTVSWTETGTGVTNDTVVPVSATYTPSQAGLIYEQDFSTAVTRAGTLGTLTYGAGNDVESGEFGHGGTDGNTSYYPPAFTTDADVGGNGNMFMPSLKTGSRNRGMSTASTIYLDTSSWAAGDYTVTFDVADYTEVANLSRFSVYEGNNDGTLQLRLMTGNGSTIYPIEDGSTGTVSFDEIGSGTNITANGEVSYDFTLTDAGNTGDYLVLAWGNRSIANTMSDSFSVDNIVILDSSVLDEAFLNASGPIAMELIDPATTATGSVALAYGTVSDDMEITSIAVSDESHGVGSFNVLSTYPATLASTNAGTSTLEVEFDNSVAGLAYNGSATGLVTVSWTETGSGVTNDTVVPVSANYTPPLPVITWESAQNVSAASDVSTNGTLIEAINAGHTSASNVTVNGVLFTAGNLLPGNSTADCFLGDTGDAAYNMLLSNVDFGTEKDVTLSLGGGSLVEGSEYSIQVWYVDDRSIVKDQYFGDDDADTSNDVQLDSKPGQYAIGTFTASATGYQDLQIRVGTSDHGGTHITAYQIRMEGLVEIGDITMGGVNGDGDLVFSWDTVNGQSYNVMTNADLVYPNWGVSDGPIVGDGSPITVTNTPSQAQLFYKVTSE